MDANNQKLIGRVLDIIEGDIVPLTRQGVAIGDKVFGAAILRQDDWSLVVAGSNHESENPLWHGNVQRELPDIYQASKGERDIALA